MQDKLSLTVKPVYVVQDPTTGKMTFGISIQEANKLVHDLEILLNGVGVGLVSYKTENGIIHKKPYHTDD